MFKSISLALILSFITYSSYGNESIVINEIAASNSSFEDENGEADDWIELYNSGTESINLHEYYFSDDTDDIQKWQLLESFSGELIINSGEYFLFWADNDINQGTFHLEFTLKKSGESIILTSPDLSTSCQVDYPELLTNISYGYDDISDSWKYFQETTPGTVNSSETFEGITPLVDYSIPGGLYIEEQLITLSSTLSGSVIRYTIDNTEPNEDSPIYSTTISISTNTNLRTTMYHSDYITNISKCESYIFDGDFNLNIVSISANDSELFGDGGIYENPFNNIEIPVSFSYFESNGSFLFSQNLGMKIHAPDNASQKSLRFYARSEYGDNTIDFPLFEEREYSNYKRFILRNGGNDALSQGKTLLRDIYGSSTFGDIDEDYGWSAHNQVHAFINGEYWGLYNMRERQDNHWLNQNYGYEAEEVDYLERVASGSTYTSFSGDWVDYNAMEQTAIDLDLSDDDNFAIIENWMNMDNYIDYNFTEIFYGNTDCISNNVKLWKPYDDSRKWEWILWDVDYGLGRFAPNNPVGLPDFDFLHMTVSWGGWGSTVYTYLIQNLIENEGFVNKFSSRGADLMNSTFTIENTEARINLLSDNLSPDIQRHFNRWSGNNSIVWNNDVDWTIDFLGQRLNYVREHFTDKFELGEIYAINLLTSPIESGFIEVNTIGSGEFPWQGYYYENIPVRLKAIPLPGFVFVEWEETGESSQEIFVDMTSDLTYTAVFEESLLPQLVINEISYQSDNSEFSDWIEIYNAGGDIVDLSEMTINDLNNNLFNFPAESFIGVGEFIIVANNVTGFTNQYPNWAENGVSLIISNSAIGLSSAEDAVILKNVGGIEIDHVHYYNGESSWPLIETSELQSIQLGSAGEENNDGENWFSNTANYESPGYQNEVVNDSSVKNEVGTNTRIGIYPNPTLNQLNIIIDTESIQKISLKLYNSIGQEIMNFGEYEGLKRYLISQELDLVPGIYTLKTQGKNTSFTKSITKL